MKAYRGVFVSSRHPFATAARQAEQDAQNVDGRIVNFGVTPRGYCFLVEYETPKRG